MKWLIALIFSSLLLFSPSSVHAIECGDDIPIGDVGLLQQYEDKCKDKIKDLQQEQGTLNAAISTINSKINLAQAQIAQTEAQIKALEEELGVLSTLLTDLNFSLDDLSASYIARVRESYKQRTISPIHLFFSSQSFGEFLEKARYLNVVKARDHLILVELEKARGDYDNQKQLKEEKQAEVEKLMAGLEAQRWALSTQKVQKQDLLNVTKNSEKEYQSLLAQARAQLSSLAGYAESVGVSLLPHQELSDDWGKYFNQRDEQWGTTLVNNDIGDCRGGKCTLARIGCLVTSYTMVVSHYGGSLLPSDVATNASNFDLGTANFNNPGPAANGHPASKRPIINNQEISIQELRDELNLGKSIIVGLSNNGGTYPDHYSDHWVVLRSVDGDSFRINDPAYSGAMKVPLNDHYAGWTIIQAKIYN